MRNVPERAQGTFTVVHVTTIAGVTLKHYQERALAEHGEFLAEWRRLAHVGDAFSILTSRAYRDFWGMDALRADGDLRQVPACTIKAPTGAGKTLMAGTLLAQLASHAFPGTPSVPRLALWLAPTQTLVDQTIRALADSRGPFQAILSAAYGHLRVVRREDLMAMRPGDLASGLTVCVSTLAGFRREDREGLRAHRDNGALMAFFNGITSDQEESLIRSESSGEAIRSLVNLLRLERPLVVLDESHRASSDLSGEVIAEMRPRYVLGLTATDREKANVLVHITPLELKQEQMLRMPVNLYPASGWMDALAAGRQRRDELEALAREAGDRVRPICLIQAEAKEHGHSMLGSGKIAVYDAVDFLTETLGVPRDHIAVRVSGVDELSGRDLLAADCPVRFVVTVKAAAEGWDCPFAMVLCAVATSKSAVDVEQLIGRCVRQDLGRRSDFELLNQTFVYASTQSFQQTAKKVVAAMRGHGFDEADVVVRPEGDTSASVRGYGKDAVHLLPGHAALWIPQLALRSRVEGKEPRPVTAAEQLAGLADEPQCHPVAGLARPHREDTGVVIDIDESGALSHMEVDIPERDDEFDEFTADSLYQSLCRRLRSPNSSMDAHDQNRLIRATVDDLLRQGWGVGELFAAFQEIARTISDEMRTREAERLWIAYERGQQRGLLTAVNIQPSETVVHATMNGATPAFARHIYSGVAPMNSEELAVAGIIDRANGVRAWWRNPDGEGFAITGPWGRMFPDFIVWLEGGRVLLLESKGPHLLDNTDTTRKERLGRVYSQAVGGIGGQFLLVTGDAPAGSEGRVNHRELRELLSN